MRLLLVKRREENPFPALLGEISLFPISAQIDFPSHKIREAPADAGIPPALKKTWRFPFFFLSFL